MLNWIVLKIEMFLDILKLRAYAKTELFLNGNCFLTLKTTYTKLICFSIETVFDIWTVCRQNVYLY